MSDTPQHANEPKTPARPEPGEFKTAPGEAEADVAREVVSTGGAANPSELPRSFKRLDHATRAQVVSRLQVQRGNRSVQRMIAKAIQRQPTVTPIPDPALPDLPALKVHHIHGGPRFDMDFDPVGPLPKIGKVVITLKVFIDFQDFKKEFTKEEPFKSYFKLHPLTAAQKADFAWTPAEKTEKGDKFKADFKKNVSEAWGGKHQFHLSVPGFAEHRATVAVQVEMTPTEAGAHTKIKLQKVPKDVAARFRSFVSGSEATLDYRDASENEKRRNPGYATAFVRQVQPFEHNKAEITSDLDSQLNEVAGEARRVREASKGKDGKYPDWEIRMIGRATSPGSDEYNKKLGMQRAEKTQEALAKKLGEENFVWGMGSKGEKNASTDPVFRRVDIDVTNQTTAAASGEPEIEQNVAAHEAGHMFGLDDEYVEEKPETKDVAAKFQGDKSDHYQKIKDLMGEEAANETLRQESGSMMSGGMEVKRGHYVFFLETLNDMTSQRWNVE